VKLTVRRCCLSLDGRVDGEKCSFLKTVCLIMCSLSLAAKTRESADPVEEGFGAL
jgi:hypothetical protein